MTEFLEDPRLVEKEETVLMTDLSMDGKRISRRVRYVIEAVLPPENDQSIQDKLLQAQVIGFLGMKLQMEALWEVIHGVEDQVERSRGRT